MAAAEAADLVRGYEDVKLANVRALPGRGWPSSASRAAERGWSSGSTFAVGVSKTTKIHSKNLDLGEATTVKRVCRDCVVTERGSPCVKHEMRGRSEAT